MKIIYLGHSCFLIKGERSVVTDPFNDIGYTMEKVSADYCLISHGHFDHSASGNVSGAVIIDGEDKARLAKDIALKVVPTFHDDMKGKRRGLNNVYKFTLGGVTFCHFGDLGETFNEATSNAIGECDVLMLPVGGNYTIDDKNAFLYANASKAKLVVPMHFKTPRSGIDIATIDGFKSRYKSIIDVKDEFVFDKNTLNELKAATLLTFDTTKF